ncbi:MAG: hypothetical protein LUE27_00370 [Clostridia bacterium]|nr:hypothetical protein [Clostridia bacterium]
MITYDEYKEARRLEDEIEWCRCGIESVQSTKWDLSLHLLDRKPESVRSLNERFRARQKELADEYRADYIAALEAEMRVLKERLSRIIQN